MMKNNLLTLIFALIIVSCSSKHDQDHQIINIIQIENSAHNLLLRNIDLANQLSEKEEGMSDKIDSLRKTTQQSLQTIEDIKMDLISKSGGIRADKFEYVNGFETAIMTDYFASLENCSYLLNTINDIVTFANSQGLEIENIARRPSEHSRYKNDPTINNKSFCEFYFHGANLLEILTTLSLFQLDIIYIESYFLQHQIISIQG